MIYLTNLKDPNLNYFVFRPTPNEKRVDLSMYIFKSINFTIKFLSFVCRLWFYMLVDYINDYVHIYFLNFKSYKYELKKIKTKKALELDSQRGFSNSY
jgi:hypothetical protein